ncbi:bifunctional helix-turn-helix transcriptional regulator/GNAT family N-acetyltransferase [Phytoactinopolyspora halotolerans]|uniref:MarR family transcriptional regulator n=1 Tax=Phytoactinopolyspora halotolerans TaxID=1981512 RepID=A0A6L9S8C6_9ACTN|nr:helix-turn-helix domain-containing GNAT family N-acetyltransferase [Phytoactinopolyspora halotolerans]NEE01456.1 MarR family transcriptional regulator [Phytoactinopolyspora halotolerans]
MATITATAADPRVAAVRRFNRFFTRQMGLLDQGLLQTRFSLTESRVIFELAQRERSEVSDVRAALGIDPAHLSRVLARFEKSGLIERARSREDARRQTVSLTQAGRDAFQTLNARSNLQAERMLARLDESEQERLVRAFATITDVLGENVSEDGGPAVRTHVIRPLRPGDLGWVVQRHGALYAEEYGWDQTFEAYVARIIAEYGERTDRGRESGWIAEVDGSPAGCVFCMRRDDQTAQLRLLLVEPAARGAGLGARLVEQCIDFARAAGYAKIVLWTNDVLTAARSLYLKAGFRCVEEAPHHSFGHDLVGQMWERDTRR